MFTVEDLRPIGLFAGLTDAQVAEVAAAADDVCIEAGAVLFRQGEPAEAWWMLVDGAIDLLRHIGREDTVVGADARARALGRRVPGLGRARRLPGDRPRGGAGPGAAGAGRGAAGPGRRLVPVRRAPHPGAVPHRAQHRVDGPAAGVAGRRWARSRPGSRTRSTIPAAAATRAVDALETACQTLLASLGRLAAADISAEPVRRARRAAPRDRAGAAGLGPAGASRISRTTCRRGWPATASSGSG